MDDVQADATALPFQPAGFDLILSDPPYRGEDALRYGTCMVDRRRVFAECVSVLTPGGHFVWLDTVHPMYRNTELRLWGEIGITRSTNRRYRIATFFERQATVATAHDTVRSRDSLMSRTAKTRPTAKPAPSRGLGTTRKRRRVMDMQNCFPGGKVDAHHGRDRGRQFRAPGDIHARPPDTTVAEKIPSLKTTGQKQRGRPFDRGQSGNPSGRPKGALNKVTVEAKAVCSEIVDNPRYRANLAKRMIAGTAPPAVECMIWYFAKGRPKERVELGAEKSFVQLVREAVEGKG